MTRNDLLKLIDNVYSEFVNDWLNLDINDDEAIGKFIPLNERILRALEKKSVVCNLDG